MKRLPSPASDLVAINRIQISGNLSPELRTRLTGEPDEDDPSESLEIRTERLRNVWAP